MKRNPRNGFIAKKMRPFTENLYLCLIKHRVMYGPYYGIVAVCDFY